MMSRNINSMRNQKHASATGKTRFMVNVENVYKLMKNERLMRKHFALNMTRSTTSTSSNRVMLTLNVQSESCITIP